MQLPPSRYKVVERGRRLEVIDTWSGERVSSPAPRPLAGGAPNDGRRPDDLSAPPASAKTAGGTAGLDSDSFVTRRWYDDKAPRTIRLNYVNRQRLLNLRWGVAIAIAMLVVLAFWFWPLAIFAVFALAAGPKLRAQIRASVTRWIDGFDHAA